MILSKDLQDIIEGVHYFLAEALTQECLSGRAECLRRGLVLQLEALTGVYPTLRIHPSLSGGVGGMGGPKGAASSASLPYLPMDQPPRPTGPHSSPATTTTTPYSSSSSGVNSSGNSSSGSSGDGLVQGGRKGGTAAPLTEEGGGGGEHEEEMYEEFDDCKDEGVEIKPEKGGGGGGGGGKDEGEEKEEDDGVYTETDEPIPFSSLIATCERHGALGKKTKGLLRNVKNYLCVAAGGMLYLYLKDTDDRQKKSIDLAGYTARSATGEDIKDTRKRDAAFEIVCPGKKTHTFIARTAKDKQEWLDALSRTMRAGKMKPTPAFSAAFSAVLASAGLNTPSTPSQPAMPPKPTASPALPSHSSQGQPSAEEYTLYNDVEDEIYEEIDGELGGGGLTLPSSVSNLKSPSPVPPPPHQVIAATTTTTTTTQPDYDPVEAEKSPSLGPPPPRPPAPARPPPPAQMQDRQAQGQVGQQVSQTSKDDGTDSDDSQIYCEIEEDMLECFRKAYPDTSGDSVGHDAGSGTPSSTLQGPQKPPSTISSLCRGALRGLGDASHKVQLPAGPPKLPPKGVPLPESEESEYKVPQSTDSEYHVPSSTPVPTEAARGAEISSPLPNPSSILQVPHTQTMLPIKQQERKPSLTDDKKPTVSSFRSGDTDSQRAFKPTTGTSVRDMIARLNQRKPPPDDVETQKTEEVEDKPATSTPAISLPKQHLRPEKPPLPARPSNIKGESPQPPSSQPQGSVTTVKEEDEDEEGDEIYDVLIHDGTAEEEASQQQGEWYIAKFAFVATLDQALSFGRGEELFVYDTSGSSGWWRATYKGKSGLVPREYLKKKG